MTKVRSTRKRHRGRWIVGGLLAAVVVIAAIQYIQPLPALYPVNKLPAITPEAAKVSWPGNAQAAVGAVGYGVLASSGASSASVAPQPTASVAKLITALSVLKKYPLAIGQNGPIITLTAADVALYNQYVAEDGSVVPVAAGEQITEYQALQAMLLPSANNMADSLAIWAYGSLPDYVSAANQLVQTLGLTDTVVAGDASGFLPGTVSTPADLVKLGEAALANPVIASIASQPQANLPLAGTVYNVNSLLGQDGIDGIKTGNNDQDGGVFVFSAPLTIGSQTIEVIGAVMGAPNLSAALADAPALLDSAKAGFMAVTAVKAAAVVASYRLPWGGTVNAVASKNALLAVWGGRPVQSALALHAIYAPLAAHSSVGSVSFTAGPQTVSTPAVLQQSIPAPPWWWRIIRH